MKQTITLNRGDSVEVHGNGLVLSLMLGEEEGIHSLIGSEEGRSRISIRQDHEDHSKLIFSKQNKNVSIYQ